MNRIITATFFVFCFLFGTVIAAAQTVYETRGANGPVFSDKPQPGAKAVELRPLNVIDNTILTGGGNPDKNASQPSRRRIGNEKPATGNVDRDGEIAAGYRSFSIVFPENDGSVVANTAIFEVRVTVEPALRLSEGHAFSVSINGKPVGQRFTATEFMIPAEFWGDQLPPPNQRIQLGATIVDRSGSVLKEALPVRFQLRYATVLQHPQKPKPSPKPELPAKSDTQSTNTVKLAPPASQAAPESQVKPLSR